MSSFATKIAVNVINLQIALRLCKRQPLGEAFVVARKGKNKEETVKQTWMTFPLQK